MFGSGAGMSARTTAPTAITAVAAGTASTATARWTMGAATTPTPATTTLVSVLSAPFLTSRRAVAYSSTAHEGGKPKCAVLL